MLFANFQSIVFEFIIRWMHQHISVMLNEVIEALALERGGLFLDATFGGGGHTRAILAANDRTRVVALDCDTQATQRAQALQVQYPGRFTFYHQNFAQVDDLQEMGFAGALFDLGVSSFQLDATERGFSFRNNAPIDMRMDASSGQSASYFLEHASREELVKAVRDYGEEGRWRQVVEAILAARGTEQLRYTHAFATLIESAIGKRYHRQKIHPATKTFQGIRIAVNRELEAIERGIPAAFEKLESAGILAVISFHSLEDRPVKRYFKHLAGRPEHRLDNRTQDERVVRAKMITRKPVTPTEQEIAQNSRSRSAKLRVIQKLAN